MNYSLTKLLGLLLLGVVTTAAYAATPPAQIPQTGQTIQYAAGDDGALQKGTVGTNSSGRFVAGTGNETDCITDTQTGLMWPKNATIGFKNTEGGDPITQPNYNNATANLNTLSWTQALTAVAKMNNATTKLCGYSDWRLPNRNELRSLVNYGQSNVATWLMNNQGQGQGFNNVQAGHYWSSTTYAASTDGAWSVFMDDGGVSYDDKANGSNYVWPVRGGQ